MPDRHRDAPTLAQLGQVAAAGRAAILDPSYNRSMSDGFYEQLREVLVYARRSGHTKELVRLNPQRRELMEAEFGVEQAHGEMRLEECASC